MEKNELEAALKTSRTSTEKKPLDASETMDKHPTRLNEVILLQLGKKLGKINFFFLQLRLTNFSLLYPSFFEYGHVGLLLPVMFMNAAHNLVDGTIIP